MLPRYTFGEGYNESYISIDSALSMVPLRHAPYSLPNKSEEVLPLFPPEMVTVRSMYDMAHHAGGFPDKYGTVLICGIMQRIVLSY